MKWSCRRKFISYYNESKIDVKKKYKEIKKRSDEDASSGEDFDSLNDLNPETTRAYIEK
jgi:hypothetical protein